ncbi:MAG: hypothetical protein CSA20_01270 [Deltaproteobacteria bacterium]|nr:MAG: hypothetical protein CSB32_00045 [Desulfobacterales bacterium]PIE73820.1 MAG: hypothetical protein CSA20_01270 [Deltaproteobacteria bacterium]
MSGMPKAVKISQTVAYLEDKRETVGIKLGCLSQGEGYQDFNGNPFQVPVWECVVCNVQPNTTKKSNGKWQYRCPVCGKEAVGKDEWQCILRWNRRNCFARSLEDVPFPALHTDRAGQKENIVTYLCEYYSLKKKEVGLTRQIAQLTGKRPPGKTYQKRLSAFHEWALLAKDILRYSGRMLQRDQLIVAVSARRGKEHDLSMPGQ